MALKTVVKVSNVTNLSDARYCAGMGVEMLGFSMDESSEHYVSPDKLSEIRGWVAGVRIVGETASTDLTEIENALAAYEPDLLQIEDTALLPDILALGLPVILKVDMAKFTHEQLAAFLNLAPKEIEYVLLESGANVNYDDELKDVLRRLTQHERILLGMGVTAGNVNELLADIPVEGIAISGGSEDRPGFRDFGQLMDVLEVLEEE